MRFDDVIQEFTQKIGVGRTAPDEHGCVSLIFDDTCEITFTEDGDDGSVLLHCELGSADALDSEACQRLLKASLLGEETGGAAFGVHFALDTVVLWKRHDDFGDCASLEKALDIFLSQAFFWKGQICGGGCSQAVPA